MAKPVLLLISGKLQSGKNTLADLITAEAEKRGATVAQGLFARALKENCRDDFMLLSNFLSSERAKLLEAYPELPPETLSWMDVQEHQWWDKKTGYTRTALQLYGTDIFRKRVSESYWVDKVREEAGASSAQLFIVTDTRYPNEVELKDVGGDREVLTLRINRPSLTREGVEEQHTSETALDDYASWDFLVSNEGSMRDLANVASVITGRLLGTTQP